MRLAQDLSHATAWLHHSAPRLQCTVCVKTHTQSGHTTTPRQHTHPLSCIHAGSHTSNTVTYNTPANRQEYTRVDVNGCVRINHVNHSINYARKHTLTKKTHSLSIVFCVSLSLCLSVSLCLCVSLCLSVSLSYSLSLSLSVALFISLCLSLSLSL